MTATRSRMFMMGALTALTFAACGPEERGSDGDADGDGDGDSDTTIDAPPAEAMKCNKMDLVFVVDDSGSMAEEQTNLASNFPMFATVLSTFTTADGDPIDYRIAVTTTGKDFTTVVPGVPIPIVDDGDNGAFRNNCSLNKRWIEPTDPDMPGTLSCRANVGTNGPSNEMPFITTKMAFAERITDGTNANFLRPDALLAIVVLTDEDDSSTTLSMQTISLGQPPVPNFHAQDLASFLDGLKGGRTRWAAGVIAGETACESPFGMATEAGRLKEFVTIANSGGTTQAVFSSICAGDLTAGLESALATFQAACNQIVF